MENKVKTDILSEKYVNMFKNIALIIENVDNYVGKTNKVYKKDDIQRVEDKTIQKNNKGVTE